MKGLRRDVTVFWLTSLLFAAASWSATGTPVLANQGQPGNQGPWPVTIVAGGTGGGSSSSAISVQDAPCLSPVETVILFDGGGATPIPPVALVGRRTVTSCNSPKNATSPLWTIRADGTAPTTALASPGQTLGLGDCISYAVGATSADGGAPIYGIADTNSSALTVTECK